MARGVENSRGESWTADRDPPPPPPTDHLQENAMVTLRACVRLENVERKPAMK